LLTGFDEDTSVLSHFVRMLDSGSNSILQVDADGSGTASVFVPIAVLTGINGLTGEVALVNGVHLVTVS
jgi:hypothetical protein